MKFPKCDETPLGIYPIVDRAYKLKPLYEVGITTAQLRTKDAFKGKELEDEIIEAIKISEAYNARFFLNDFWELGIKHKVYGIHLGQEDIQEADVQAILNAGIRLGISTHTPKEIDIALEFEPSYLAIGPIYVPISKKLVYDTIGTQDLISWSLNVDYPIVAIGGITIENIADVAKTKAVSGIAMISDILENKEVSKKRTLALIDIFNKY
ncbi:thiamine phosphate synthase [Poseidonibacter lekithochrous]|uniref:thiamine phosphate synthase n=1 Tax=Poseidonibacter TaxID=2321187 RepID=UPI001C0A6545|nr:MULTISPECIES: thiamine phosphate synthase [Poseidonibacter]MBU3013125.1 thiamine phosphate synthase [Poseidonibacter lekithochrous]MDO6826421.1 thiamine phosphate synthase [Poseidonibacter sp. 1_MG-2023]